jgi:hypothetical protein
LDEKWHLTNVGKYDIIGKKSFFSRKNLFLKTIYNWQCTEFVGNYTGIIKVILK